MSKSEVLGIERESSVRFLLPRSVWEGVLLDYCYANLSEKEKTLVMNRTPSVWLECNNNSIHLAFKLE